MGFRYLIRTLTVLAALLLAAVPSLSAASRGSSHGAEGAITAASATEAAPTNLPPTGATLIEPDVAGLVTDVNNPGGPHVYPGTNVTFLWAPGSDPDGDAVTYRLEVCTTSIFLPPELCIVVSGITGTSYQLNDLAVGITYYWRVFTVDAYGNSTPNIPDNPDVPRSFIPSVSSLPTMLKVTVMGNIGTPGGIPLVGASVSLAGRDPVRTIEGGVCLIVSDAGTYTVTVSADHYQQQTFQVTLYSGAMVAVDVLLEPDPNISVTILGTGSGTVSSSPPGKGFPADISCTKDTGSTCRALFELNEVITLTATSDWKSHDVVWGGNCNGISTTWCQLAVDNSKNVTADFTPNLQARVGATGYASLQEAYDNLATLDGSIIMAREYTFLESLLFNIAKTITIDGGWDSGYTLQTGVTTIDGTLAVRNGRLNIRGVVVK